MAEVDSAEGARDPADNYPIDVTADFAIDRHMLTVAVMNYGAAETSCVRITTSWDHNCRTSPELRLPLTTH